MKITSVSFVCSYAQATSCTPDSKPEFAVIGRSNVGKSSLINFLLERKAIAKISSRPGKTRLLNLFLVNEQWLLMDMPGYGWATCAKTEARRMQHENEAYLSSRENLTCLFILLDCRHKPLSIDLDFIRWAGKQQLPLALVFTKTDKISKSKLKHQVNSYQAALYKDWEDLPPHFTTSALHQSGREELLRFVESTIKRFCALPT